LNNKKTAENKPKCIHIVSFNSKTQALYPIPKVHNFSSCNNSHLYSCNTKKF